MVCSSWDVRVANGHDHTDAEDDKGCPRERGPPPSRDLWRDCASRGHTALFHASSTLVHVLLLRHRVDIAGVLTLRHNSRDYVTLAYSTSTGAKMWASRYNGPGHDLDLAYSVAVSPDGTQVFVTGESAG